MKPLLTALSLVLCVSCSPEARLANLIKKHPELSKRDTITRVDTLVIAPSSVDTLIYFNQTDTVIIKENGVTVKYFYNTRDSTVYIRGERDTIRIIREVPVTVNTFDVKPLAWYERAWLKVKDFLIVALIGAVLVMLYITRRKPLL